MAHRGFFSMKLNGESDVTPVRLLRFVSLTCVWCAMTMSTVVNAAEWDYLITGGLVFDGSGTEGVRASVGVEDGRIVYVGPADASHTAGVVVDAHGLVVAPGFIDPHTHALALGGEDGPLPLTNYITQGVSTVFSGNDGGGPVDVEGVLTRLDGRGLGANMALYIGHGSARRKVMGMNARAPSMDELGAMEALVAGAMQSGAFGLSTGLFYAPGSFAKTDEVVALARVAARHGGIYDSHIRDESNYGIGLLAAVDEVIEVGRKAGLPVHISHIKALGVDVWGLSAEVIAHVNAARAAGVRVSADQYPWRASGTSITASLVPRWAMAGGREAMLARFDVPEQADRIRAEMRENMRRRGGASSLLLTSGKDEWRGMTLETYARKREEDPIETALHVIRAGDASVASFNMNEDDIKAFMVQPWVMTGSDGSGGHPRLYASFPRKHQKYVVEDAVLTLSQFIARSTSLPAETLGLESRGRLQAGYHADIVLFDPETYAPRATFEEPTLLSDGVQYLFVGGRPAIWQGQVQEGLHGKALRKNSQQVQE